MDTSCSTRPLPAPRDLNAAALAWNGAPLRFEPQLKSAIWGGNRLKSAYRRGGAKLPNIAESWEVADLPGWETFVSQGPLAGRSLRELMKLAPARMLGNALSLRRFPLLVKLIDAREQLSVQVHPPWPALCEANDTSFVKAEAWVVLEAAPGSRMSLGLQPGVTEADFRRALVERSVPDLLHSYAPRPGDCVFLPPGSIHALGGGIVVAEIQLTCDVTYRLYDWDRVDAQGRARELHVDQALAAADFSYGPIRPTTNAFAPDAHGQTLVDSPYFTIRGWRGPAAWSVPDDDRMHVLTLATGRARIRDEESDFTAGDSLVLPAQREECVVELGPDAVLLDSCLPDGFPPPGAVGGVGASA